MNPAALLLVAALSNPSQPLVELSEEERKARRKADIERDAAFEKAAAEHKAKLEKRAAEWEAGRAAREAEAAREEAGREARQKAREIEIEKERVSRFEAQLLNTQELARQEREKAQREADAYLRSRSRKQDRRGEGL